MNKSSLEILTKGVFFPFSKTPTQIDDLPLLTICKRLISPLYKSYIVYD